MSPSKRYYEITGPAALDWNDVRRQSQASTVTTVTAYRVGQVVEMFARPDHDRDSIIQGQLRHVNKRVANHPLCVIGFRQSDDGQQQLVTCLQMTTFDGQLLNEKYHNWSEESRLRQQEYVVLAHSGEKCDGRPALLSLAAGQMDKQTYIHLDQFFMVEAKHLTAWRTGAFRLDAPSIDRLEHMFIDFISGGVRRVKSDLNNPKAIISPLDYRAAESTPSWLGVKVHPDVEISLSDSLASLAISREPGSSVTATPELTPSPDPLPTRGLLPGRNATLAFDNSLRSAMSPPPPRPRWPRRSPGNNFGRISEEKL